MNTNRTLSQVQSNEKTLNYEYEFLKILHPDCISVFIRLALFLLGSFPDQLLKFTTKLKNL